MRCTSLEWERSKAWAFQQAMGLVWYYADSNPVIRTSWAGPPLDRIMAEPEALPEPLPVQTTRSISHRRIADGLSG